MASVQMQVSVARPVSGAHVLLRRHGYFPCPNPLTSPDYQKTVGNLPLYLLGQIRDLIGHRKHKVEILNEFDGIIEPGELLVVLGPPGSGCTTLLKTIAGEMNGIYLGEGSEINYRGTWATFCANSRH